MTENPIIRITKEFKFEMAHSLPGYNGLCKNIHGHSYKLLVSVAGQPITGNNNSKLGMVMDFGDLKKIARKVIVEKFDHALVLSCKTPSTLINQLKQYNERLVLLNYQPTSELMIIDFVQRIKEKLPENIQLKHVLLRETVTAYAEWFAEDNP